MSKNALTMASVALIMSSTALAAPPTGFSYSNFSVSGGTITTTCPSGYTCTTLPATGNGILQRQVTNASGESYYQTIVVPDNATAANASALSFESESFVGTTSDSGNLAVHQTVKLELDPNDLGSPTTSIPSSNELGTGVTIAEIVKGDLVGPGDPTSATGDEGSGILLQQNLDTLASPITQTTTGPGGTESFYYIKNGDAAGDQTNYKMEIDSVDFIESNDGSQELPFTVRKASGAYTACATATCNLTLPDSQTVSYIAGDAISTVWWTGIQYGDGAPADLVVENQTFSNDTTGVSKSWNNVSVAAAAAFTSDTAEGVQDTTVVFNTVNGSDPANPHWKYWDTNFGAAPNGYVVAGSGSTATIYQPSNTGGYAGPATTTPTSLTAEANIFSTNGRLFDTTDLVTYSY